MFLGFVGQRARKPRIDAARGLLVVFIASAPLSLPPAAWRRSRSASSRAYVLEQKGHAPRSANQCASEAAARQRATETDRALCTAKAGQWPDQFILGIDPTSQAISSKFRRSLGLLFPCLLMRDSQLRNKKTCSMFREIRSNYVNSRLESVSLPPRNSRPETGSKSTASATTQSPVRGGFPAVCNMTRRRRTRGSPTQSNQCSYRRPPHAEH
jgi:hypothetical protein